MRQEGLVQGQSTRFSLQPGDSSTFSSNNYELATNPRRWIDISKRAQLDFSGLNLVLPEIKNAYYQPQMEKVSDLQDLSFNIPGVTEVFSRIPRKVVVLGGAGAGIAAACTTGIPTSSPTVDIKLATPNSSPTQELSPEKSQSLDTTGSSLEKATPEKITQRLSLLDKYDNKREDAEDLNAPANCVDYFWMTLDAYGITHDIFRPSDTAAIIWNSAKDKESVKALFDVIDPKDPNYKYQNGDIGFWGEPFGKYVDSVDGKTKFAGHVGVLNGKTGVAQEIDPNTGKPINVPAIEIRDQNFDTFKNPIDEKIYGSPIRTDLMPVNGMIGILRPKFLGQSVQGRYDELQVAPDTGEVNGPGTSEAPVTAPSSAEPTLTPAQRIEIENIEWKGGFFDDPYKYPGEASYEVFYSPDWQKDARKIEPEKGGGVIRVFTPPGYDGNSGNLFIFSQRALSSDSTPDDVVKRLLSSNGELPPNTQRQVIISDTIQNADMVSYSSQLDDKTIRDFFVVFQMFQNNPHDGYGNYNFIVSYRAYTENIPYISALYKLFLQKLAIMYAAN